MEGQSPQGTLSKGAAGIARLPLAAQRPLPSPRGKWWQRTTSDPLSPNDAMSVIAGGGTGKLGRTGSALAPPRSDRGLRGNRVPERKCSADPWPRRRESPLPVVLCAKLSVPASKVRGGGLGEALHGEGVQRQSRAAMCVAGRTAEFAWLRDSLSA